LVVAFGYRHVNAPATHGTEEQAQTTGVAVRFHREVGLDGE
jgi:hypothetical protein